MHWDAVCKSNLLTVHKKNPFKTSQILRRTWHHCKVPWFKKYIYKIFVWPQQHCLFSLQLKQLSYFSEIWISTIMYYITQYLQYNSVSSVGQNKSHTNKGRTSKLQTNRIHTSGDQTQDLYTVRWHCWVTMLPIKKDSKKQNKSILISMSLLCFESSSTVIQMLLVELNQEIKWPQMFDAYNFHISRLTITWRWRSFKLKMCSHAAS